MTIESILEQKTEEIMQGGIAKYHDQASKIGKLFARERIKLLFDADEEFIEDGLFANCESKGLPADGIVTAMGKVNGQTVCVMANDSTIKAGSWGARTVEKIIRIQEQAIKYQVPMIYLVDSAGARITDQVEMFPGRRGAGKIFYNQVQMSGFVPQVCALFGPSAAGGAYIPAFCDIVIMVDKNASMYLGSPRMAEAVIGEKVTLEEMGGAKMHCTTSGCGDMLVKTEQEAIKAVRDYLAYFPANCMHDSTHQEPIAPEIIEKEISQIIPENQNMPYDMIQVIKKLVDQDSLFEIKKLFAREIITGLARMDGRVIGIVANQPKVKGGVIFVDSADKTARFVSLCDAFNIPLLFLADVPGFMIGSNVEKQGIIRHGAKMISAISEASVTKMSVVLRKAYGAGLYAMCGPGFAPECCIALPSASIAVMGAEPAVNAVYYNKMEEIEDLDARKAFKEEKMREYEEDINLYRLGSELIIDTIIPDKLLRKELIKRFDMYSTKDIPLVNKKHGVTPV
ncbi:MAG: acyl-CoA carboxylase subunit beta [Candidatus Sericytochromatia bacterium]|nr:acyl-CoA carboxylase subunit beta [Candidatus Sericytochromatia bacterium]